MKYKNTINHLSMNNVRVPQSGNAKFIGMRELLLEIFAANFKRTRTRSVEVEWDNTGWRVSCEIEIGVMDNEAVSRNRFFSGVVYWHAYIYIPGAVSMPEQVKEVIAEHNNFADRLVVQLSKSKEAI